MAAATVNAAMEQHLQINSAIINFTLNWLRGVDCHTCASFSASDAILHKISHLFMFMLPNDYLTIAKL